MSHTVKVPCNTEIGEEQCEQVLELEVGWEPEEREMEYVRYQGGFFVDSPVSCPKHELTDEQVSEIEGRAIQEVRDELENQEPSDV